MWKWFRNRRLHRQWKPDCHQYTERPPVTGPRFTESEAVRRFNSQPVTGYWPPFIPPVLREPSPPQGIPEIAQRQWMEHMKNPASDGRR